MNADTQLFQIINDVARSTPRLHPIMPACVASGRVGGGPT